MNDPVANELSFYRFRDPDQPCAAGNHWEARSWMSSFVRTLAETANIGFSRSLRTLDGFSYQELIPGYSIVQWRNDQQVSRDERQLFRQYTTKSPLLDGVLERILEREGNSEASFEGVDSKGLLAAFLLDTLAVGLPSDAAWQSTRVRVAIAELNEDGDIVLTDEVVLHAATIDHVREHAQLYEARRMDLATSGRDILEQRELLLPRIRFCQNVEEILVDMGPSDDRFTWVRRSLFELNDVCNLWNDGEFRHDKLRGSPSTESETVNNDPELRKLRVFTCPDGQELYFQWHLKNYSKNLRMYYVPDADNRIVIVGYLGPHLRTARY